MSQRLMASGASIVLIGVALVVPVVAERLEHGPVPDGGIAIAACAVVLVWSGLLLILRGARGHTRSPLPPPVRGVVVANILFLAFCALETSDGLIRQGGRLLYWTSVLFVPALVLHAGMLLARRWAWWAARALTALFGLWFVVFIALIPFADLRGGSGPVPFRGRLYMMAVTVVFAGIAGYAFRALGSAPARRYFGIVAGDPEFAPPSQRT
jgi:hypothetical protein